MSSVARHALGAIDIGGTKIAVGIVDSTGQVLGYGQRPTDAALGFEPVMNLAAKMLDSIKSDLQIDIAGIGIGCTGPVYPSTGVIGKVEFLPGWEGCNPVDWFARVFALPVAMENDADAVALGEARWGTGRGAESLLCVTIGTGVGAGLVLSGALYRGVDGAHPELGHHVIDRDGPPCFCGARGCWEVLTAGPAMARRMLEVVAADDPDRDNLSAKLIFERARQGDPLAIAQTEIEAELLGIGVANLVTLFAPDVIALGGNLMNAEDLLMAGIRKVVGRNCGLVPFHATTIKRVSFQDHAGLVGAAAAWLHQFGERAACAA